MQRTLYSRHLSVVDISLRSRLTFPPRSDLPIADTTKNESPKQFLCEVSVYFISGSVFTFLLSFSSILFIFEPVYDLFRATKIKISQNLQFVSTSSIDAFPSYKDVQNTMGQGQEYKYNLGHILWHMLNHHFFVIRTDTNHSNSSLSLQPSLNNLFCSNQWFKNFRTRCNLEE